MLPVTRTARQRIIELLTDTRLSSRQLAQLIGLPERQVEEHLTHVAKTIGRDKTKRFILEPAMCPTCEFIFRELTKLTLPSRCPRSRGEGISPPRYGIEWLPT